MGIIKGYKILGTLYQTPNTVLYRGLRLLDNLPVMLKCPYSEHPSLNILADLQHEYFLLKQLNIPGIIKPYALIQQGHLTVLVLEDIDGQTLKSFLQEKPLELDVFFTIALQLVYALAELHQQHIIHKDIKPANIIIEPHTLLIKLADFSISSQLLEETQGYNNLHLLEGSLAYISPEQTGRMNRSIDYRTDFYALGVTFYEMLAGHLPFDATDILELVHCHLAKAPVPLSSLPLNIPTMLSQIIIKLMSKMPEERYASARGLAADLAECAKQWQSNKTIAEFVLGAIDISDQLQQTQKLYGREEPIAELLAAFERVSQGKNEVVLVSGYSGIGKTSLVKEIYKPLTCRKGYFIQGKYDQLQQNKPYSALIDALQNLIRQVLAEPEQKLKHLKQALQQSIGNQGHALLALIPSIKRLLGPQSLLENTIGEAQNQLTFAFQQFIQVFCQADHPLVIFLDDLQWADNASLQLLQRLLKDTANSYFMLIGTYRDNEVDFGHPLVEFQKKLMANGVVLNTIKLPPLTHFHLQQLLADTLGCGLARAKPLAEILQIKTEGNPFFAHAFLKNLHHNHLLTFDYKKGQWQWDIMQIAQQHMTENVVDLLINNIQQLSPPAQDNLKLAACIGSQFDLHTLSVISQQSVSLTLRLLQEALHASLIQLVCGNYKSIDLMEGNLTDSQLSENLIIFQFKHDRILQATYQLIVPNLRRELHLNIGRLLLTNADKNSGDETHLGQIVRHLNEASSLITKPEERLELAEFNLQVGKKAIAVAAYQAAKNYFSMAVSLLPQDAWKDHYDLTFALYCGLSESELLTDDHQLAQQHLAILFKQAKTKLDRMRVYQLDIIRLSLANRYNDALQQGLAVLRLFGLDLPLYPKPYHILTAYMSIEWRLYGKKFTNLDLTQQASNEYSLLQKILNQLYASTYITSNKELFVLLIFHAVKLSLRYGYTPESSYCFAAYAFVLIHVFKRYDASFKHVALAYRLAEHYPDPSVLAKVEFCMGHFLHFWKYPLSQSLNYTLHSYQLAQQTGDLATADYSFISHFLNQYALSYPLSDLANTLREVLKKRSPNDYFYPVWILLEYSVINLQHSSINKDFDQEIARSFKSVAQCKTQHEQACFYFCAIKIAYLSGKFSLAVAMGLDAEIFADSAIGTITYVEGQLYYALSLAASYKTATITEQSVYKKKLRAIQKSFKRWAGWCATNFEPYYLVLSAEIFAIQENYRKSSDLYDQAAQLALDNNHPQLTGVINECAARFYSQENKPHIAKHYFREAHYGYERWGALALCQRLKQQYPQSFYEYDRPKTSLQQKIMTNTQTSTSSSDLSIDFMAILKLTQTIASEIQFDKLLKKLLKIVLENAGAQRSVLIIKKDNSWLIEAEGTLEQQRIWLVDAKSVETRSDLPLTIINYVQRTEEAVLIQDVANDIQFLDPYLQQSKSKSILIIPFFYQGQLRRILYLENNMLKHSFTDQHLQDLTIVVSQAAISLENAYLYYQATHDPLTGFANRNLLFQIFQQSASRLSREAKQLAIIFLDLDYFKIINDTMGHEVGDKLLIYFSEQIKSCLRAGDLPVRLGGDEFVILLDSLDESMQVKVIMDKIYQKLAVPVIIQGHTIHISTSAGISLFPKDATDIQSLLKQADTALYRAKELGKNQYQFYSVALTQYIQQNHHLETEFENALANQEFCLFYQPIFDLVSERIISLEVLLRWQHPTKGLLEAKQFIQLLEKTPFMLSVGEWVLRTACQQVKSWQNKDLPRVPIAVNISALQFENQSLSQLIADILAETQLQPVYLELELTESILIESASIINEMEALKNLGVNLVIDDFGKGYSCLAYLTRLSLSKLKIDRSFINKNQLKEQDKIILEAIIGLAHRLQMQVIAEGVEEISQVNLLRIQHVDAVQGYYFSPPLSVNDCEHLLNGENADSE
ncbi:MAG: EAL domain-containing protein [Legionella sp.]|uniref:EAL domain-containing protein n=1 Tax=Legionella sp. TaxID=459 RepID=UPI002845C286|nr:EAL domain-containing protein [Legionella sp.]